MELNELYRLIRLPAEILPRLEEAAGQTDPEGLEPCLEQLTDKAAAPEAYERLTAILGTDPDHIRMLLCQLKCACRIYDRYLRLGISDTIYRDTMKCFSRFLAECQRKNGRMFFDRGWWTYRQISMSLFRIGALEYEFPPGAASGSIALHIPSDADLTEKSVDASLEEADIFFRTRFPRYEYDKYVCGSWLLAPALRPLLPEDSNILSFQRRFVITDVTHEDSGCMEWLFHSPPDRAPGALPEDTRLQRAAKKVLLEGGHIGAASGILGRKSPDPGIH